MGAAAARVALVSQSIKSHPIEKGFRERSNLPGLWCTTQDQADIDCGNSCTAPRVHASAGWQQSASSSQRVAARVAATTGSRTAGWSGKLEGPPGRKIPGLSPTMGAGFAVVEAGVGSGGRPMY